MLLSKLFEGVLKNANIDTQKFGELLNAMQFEITDGVGNEFLNEFNKNYFTLEAAQSHPKVAAHYRAITLSPIDEQLESLLPEDLKEGIKSEKSTYDKLRKSLTQLKTKLEAVKETPETKEGVAKLQDEIKNLNKQISDLTEQKEAELLKAKEEAVNPYKQKIRDKAFDSLFFGKQYPSDFPVDVFLATHKSKLTEKLKELNADLRFNEENESFNLFHKGEELPLILNNKPIILADLIDEVGSTNKLYKQSEAAPQPGITKPTNPVKVNSTLMERLEEYSKEI